MPFCTFYCGNNTLNGVQRCGCPSKEAGISTAVNSFIIIIIIRVTDYFFSQVKQVVKKIEE